MVGLGDVTWRTMIVSAYRPGVNYYSEAALVLKDMSGLRDDTGLPNMAVSAPDLSGNRAEVEPSILL